MRPGVYASVMRNRKTSTRRVTHQPHKFAWRRFFIMACGGAVLFIPGLIVTIIGLDTKDVESVPGDSVLYKVIGPAALAIGVGLLFAAFIYYCCWGFQAPVKRRHPTKHKRDVEHDEQYDPLQTSSVPAISDGHHHQTSAHKIVRSHGSSTHGSDTSNHHRSHGSSTHGSESSNHHQHHQSGHRTNSVTISETRSTTHRANHHSNHSHHNAYRASSRSLESRAKDSPLQSRAKDSPQNRSRHRSTSSHSSGKTHPSNPPPQHPRQHHQHHHQADTANHVAFVNTSAPLAQGESGSMDITILQEGNTEKY